MKSQKLHRIRRKDGDRRSWTRVCVPTLGQLALLAMVWYGVASAAHGAETNELARSVDDVIVQTWDVDSGLPDSDVSSLVQSADGYIWIGFGHGGIVRFDGRRFQCFDPSNAPELRSIEIYKLLTDAHGVLWIGDVEGGLISYQDSRYKFEHSNNAKPLSVLESLLSRHEGQARFASLGGMVYRCFIKNDSNTWETIYLPNASAQALTVETEDGTLWYRSSDFRLMRMQGTNAVCVQRPLLEGVSAITKDSRGRLWIGHGHGVTFSDGTNFNDIINLGDQPVGSVQQVRSCPDGAMWILGSRYLRRMVEGRCQCSIDLLSLVDQHESRNPTDDFSLQFVDSRNGAWLWHNQKKLLYVTGSGEIDWLGDCEGKIVGGIACWMQDREGNIWMGMNNRGLARLRPRVFHSAWPADGIDSPVATSVCETPDGVIWLGTSKQQVARLQKQGFFTISPDFPPYSDEVKLYPGDNGALWIGSVQGGVLRLENGEFSRPFPSQDIGTVARCLLQDSAGGLWIGSEFGLSKWQGNRLKRFSTADGFASTYVLSLAEDRNHDVWCGTALGELRQYHEGVFASFRPSDSMTTPEMFAAAAAMDQQKGVLSGGERFLALFFDDEGTLWIGSLSGGLLRFRNGSFFRFPTRDHLPGKIVSQILGDDRKNLWLGTRTGIIRVAIRELNAFADGHGGPPNYIQFDRSDGLPTLECSAGAQPACWRSHDGRLWFSTTRGAVWVDPSRVPANDLPPPVRVEEVKVDGRPVVKPPGSPRAIQIPTGRHYLEFQLSALSFTAPEKVRFRWRLVGLDSDWVEGGNRSEASYGYIPPGGYQFEVTACNNDGLWNSAPARVDILVRPYLWQERWFRLTGALLIAGAIAALYFLRIARMQELERLRLRIARDLHDEVGANLGSISLLAQMMHKNPSPSDALQVGSIAAQTVDTLRDIIWLMQPSHDNLRDLVERLRESSGLMLSAIRWHFDLKGDFDTTSLSVTFRRNVPSMFKEVLHNILKHSKATEVQITALREGDRFQARISDNGIGFDVNHKCSGCGLRNLRKRAAEIGGEVNITSTPGAGTTIALSAPITGSRKWFALPF